jgi:uncharacterized protein YfiM (DUF2279 family)
MHSKVSPPHFNFHAQVLSAADRHHGRQQGVREAQHRLGIAVAVGLQLIKGAYAAMSSMDGSSIRASLFRSGAPSGVLSR